MGKHSARPERANENLCAIKQKENQPEKYARYE